MLSFGLATYHMFASLPYCHDKASNLHYPSKPLIGYVTACSAPLIALLVAGAGSSMWEHGYLGISLYHAYLINLDYTLGKGWKAQALCPGVLFHSCQPSFRNTGVMFLDERS